MKNLVMFLEITGLVLLVLMLTGCIPEDTPIIGALFYDIIIAIRESIETQEISGVMKFFSATLSIISSLSMLTIKCKSITLADIKSTKLKIALIQAGFYFNSNGKLVKKVEKATQTDLDGDGKIDDEEEVYTGPLKKVVNAVKEFTIIMKTDFTENDNVKSDTYQNVLKEADLEKAAKGVDELEDSLITDGVNAIAKKGEEVANSKLQQEIIEGEDTKESVSRIGTLQRMKAWFQELPNKVAFGRKQYKEKKEAQMQAEILENNMANDAVTKEEEDIKIEPKKEESKKTVPTINKYDSSVPKTEAPKKKSESETDALIAQIRGNNKRF